MIAEARLPNGIAVALNNSPKSVAFTFQGQNAFLDLRQGVLAIWDRKALNLDGTEHAHNKWHVLEEDSVLWKYFKDLIASDYVNPLEGMGAFFRQ